MQDGSRSNGVDEGSSVWNSVERTPTVSGEKVMSRHQRLGNIGEKGLRLLHGKGMVEGMSNFSLDFDFCEHCLYGNKNLVRFPFCLTRAKEFYS